MTKTGIGNKQLFFAYGSNMNPGQISSRCRSPRPCAVARLADHEVAFYGESRRWDGGEATVVGKPGAEVWGVVYELTLADSERLDSWQDVRLDGTGAYFHYPTVVVDAQGKEYQVLIYKRFLSGAPSAPSEEYLSAVIAGAASNALPVAYLERLRRIATVKAGFPVPRIFEHELSSTFATNSCDCGLGAAGR
jgi:gamma-glutamylcyclotransferase